MGPFFCLIFKLILTTACMINLLKKEGVNKMKKLILLTGSMAILSVGTGVVANAQSSSETTTTLASMTTEVKTEVLKELITLEDALKIFAEKYPNVGVTSVELAEDRQSMAYKIEGEDENKEYELMVGAKTKELVFEKVEANNDYDANEIVDFTKLISFDEAGQLALTEVPNGTIMKFSVDYEEEQRKTVLEVKLLVDKQEYEVEIDAVTGEVISVAKNN